MSTQEIVKQGYKKIARYYHKRRLKNTKTIQLLNEIIKKFPKKGKVLDVGCGSGYPVSKYFVNKKYNVTGIDISPQMIQIAKKIVKKAKFYVKDMTHLDFQNESFDAFICKSVLEHVEDPFQATRELYRVLKKGGYGIIYVPFLFPYHAEPGFYKDYWRFTEDALRLLCKDFSKIELVKVRGLFGTVVHMVPIARFWLKWPAYFLDRLFPARNQTSGFTVFVTK